MNIVWQKIDLAPVDKLVASAIRMQGKANAAIQVAAVSVIAHAAKHGDYSKAAILVDGLEGAFRASLIEWFVKFGGLTVEGGKFSGWQGADYIRASFADAKETPWYKVKKEVLYQGFDLDQEIRGLLDRAAKAAKKAANDEAAADLVRIDEAQLLALKGTIRIAA
jgi:hypothetical protein